MLVAFDSIGQEVRPGDCILNFRGDPAVFVKATKARTQHSGKVVVRYQGNCEQEVYDNAYDLHVKEVE